MMRILLLSVILIYFAIPFTKGQVFNSTYKFQTYTSKEGLVHNFVKKCVQDSKGFLWIITQHGLSRFDGVNFKNFEHQYKDSNSLPENDILDIAIDTKDNIWLSYKKGICFYNQATHSFTIITQNGFPLKSQSIVFDAKRNCIWSVDYDGYTKIDCALLTFQKKMFKKAESNRVQIYPLLLDRQDRLWIPYGRSHYHCIDLAKQKEYYHPDAIEPTSFYEDRKHQIWVTTWQTGFKKLLQSDSIHQYENYGDPFLKIASNKYDYISQAVTESAQVSGDSILWVLKNTDGLLLFNKNTGKFVQHFVHDGSDKNGIATDFNENIYCDRSGIIWICSWHGLTKVNMQEQQFSSREIPWLSSQLYNAVSGIVDDPYQKNIAWLSANGSGIFKLDKSTGAVIKRYFYYFNEKNFTGADQNYNWRWPATFIIDKDKNIWTVNYGGVVKIKNGEVQKIPILTSERKAVYPFALKQFSKGFLWISSGLGLFKLNTTDNSYTFYPDPTVKKGMENWNGDLEMLDNNHLIASGDKGVKLFTISTQQFSDVDTYVKGIDSASQLISRSTELIGNKLYIGTFAGLKEYNFATHTTRFIGKEQGISKVDVHRLYQDAKQNLWVFTAGGLFRYDTHTMLFEKFTTNDGIYDLSEDPIHFFKYNNLIHIGYRMAITSFDALKVNVNHIKVNPVISEVMINGNEIDQSIDSFANKSLQLNYSNNEITFNYTAPDFTNADKITFMYQLKGFDKEWISAGTRRTVTYNNLLPGDYTFQLKATNSSGLMNNNTSIFLFTIKPPFWQTWWFRLLVVAVVCSGIYFFYQYRLKQLKKSYEVRSNISRNLHDEIGATLSSINIYSEVARKKNNDIESTQLLNKIYEASTKAMDSMNDIVWYINPKNDVFENMLVKMREYALPLLEAKNVQVIFKTDAIVDSIKLSMHQRQHVYLIFKEAINNIAKYAAANNVHIHLHKQDQMLFMNVIDDGIGFDNTKLQTGNGLQNIQYRCNELNGILQISTAIHQGTNIQVSFKIA
jgi:ligand-binding sensor domain-containing protein